MKRMIVVLSVILFAGCAEQGMDLGELIYKEEMLEVFEDSLDAQVTSIECETFNGYIKVHLWDNQEYKIEINKWARAATSAEAEERVESIIVDIVKTGTIFKVEVEQIRNAGADFSIFLPRKTFDKVELTTSNGYIETDVFKASDVSMRTSNGSIEAYVTADTIRVDTSNASIQGFFQGAQVTLETSNGLIDIECGDGGEYLINTSNARVNMIIGSSGEFDISTSNGTVDIVVSGDFNFDLVTSNATVQVSVDRVTYTEDSRAHKKGYTTEDAGVILKVSSSNGSITVAKK